LKQWGENQIYALKQHSVDLIRNLRREIKLKKKNNLNPTFLAKARKQKGKK
jgi:hypothetical protein